MADEQKQEPAAPKKDKGGLPFPLFGLIGFAIMLIALLVNLFLILGIKSEVGAISNVIVSGGLPIGSKDSNSKDKANENDENSDEPSAQGQYVADENAEYFETGRITTNPRMSSNFVVINLGLFFIKEKSGEEEAPPEGEGKEATATSFSPFGKKFDGMLRNIVNSQIGSMSLEELQIPRDSISKVFIEKLKPLFRQQKTKLKEIAIVEFIVQ